MARLSRMYCGSDAKRDESWLFRIVPPTAIPTALPRSRKRTSEPMATALSLVGIAACRAISGGTNNPPMPIPAMNKKMLVLTALYGYVISI